MPPTQLPPSKRLYLRNLPKHINEETLQKHLSNYGKIVEVKIIHDYAFVQFDLEQDARDVVEKFRSQLFLGQAIIVEFSRPLRKEMSIYDSDKKGEVSIFPRPAPANVQSRYPIIVTNIPRKVRWQELKDFGRISGALVAYCDLDRKRRGRGFIEYFSREDALRAIQELDGRILGGKPVTVSGLQESYSRGHRSRSRSPSRYEEMTRQWSVPRHQDHAPPHVYTSKSRGNYHYESPPPSYTHRNSPISHYHSYHRASGYYPSSPPSPPSERVNIPETAVRYSAAALYRPTEIAYFKTEEQYDYAGHPMRLDSWKYEYDREYGYQNDGSQWETERPLQPGHQNMDYYPLHLHPGTY